MELFARGYGIKMTHVPYKGATPALTDLMGGQVQVLFTGLPPTLSVINAGKVNALVVSGPKRAQWLPSVPSMGDLNMLSEDVVTWFGLLAPAATPKAVVNDLSRRIAAILKEPQVATALTNQGVVIVGSTPQEFEDMIQKDLKRWPPLIPSLGIIPE
jgi:tripartite-type tricarboxylate transporter receptor subunit TctC